MAPGRKERVQRKSFVGPVRADIHEQAVTHYLLDAKLHYLGDTSAGDTRTEHGFDIRHEEAALCGYLRDLLTPMELPLEGFCRHWVIKHDSLMFPHVLRIGWLSVLSHIPRRRDRDDARLEQLSRHQCSHWWRAKAHRKVKSICHQVADVVAHDEFERKVRMVSQKIWQ